MKKSVYFKIAAMILFFAMGLTNIFPNAALSATYVPRTAAPDPSNQFYYSNLNGFWPGFVGQCTWYAYGRGCEILGLNNKPKLSLGPADGWYAYNDKYKYYPSSTNINAPKLGAIACYANHVAVVEKVVNGIGYVSEGNYIPTGSTTGIFHYGDPVNHTPGFQGYIYLPTSGSSIGVTNGTFYLRNINSTGVSDIALLYGNPWWIPITGDWDGNGTTTVGVYDQTKATFYLRNSNSSGVSDIAFTYGNPNWKPITGDWNGDGKTEVGVYAPASGTFYLRNSNKTGDDVNFSGFTYGNPNWKPITGDWNGDGKTEVGVYVPTSSTFYLRNSNKTGDDVNFSGFTYGGTNWIPITGDWSGDGKTEVGVYVPASAIFYLRNSNKTGDDKNFAGFNYGNPNWTPITGDWDGNGTTTIGVCVAN